MNAEDEIQQLDSNTMSSVTGGAFSTYGISSSMDFGGPTVIRAFPSVEGILNSLKPVITIPFGSLLP